MMKRRVSENSENFSNQLHKLFTAQLSLCAMESTAHYFCVPPQYLLRWTNNMHDTGIQPGRGWFPTPTLSQHIKMSNHMQIKNECRAVTHTAYHQSGWKRHKNHSIQESTHITEDSGTDISKETIYTKCLLNTAF